MPDSTSETMPVRPVQRQLILDDLTIRSDGSGRIVEAYAAVFGTRTEIRDQDGHYLEMNDPSSFNRTIQHKGPAGFGVLFNHGRTVDGAPNPLATMPIGVPVEVRADERGVFTATRYLENPLANDVLEAIKAGALKAQSFSGRFLRSVRSRSTGALPTITRMETDMREYGPAVFAAYTDAAILGTRSLPTLEAALDSALGQAPSPALRLFTRQLLAMPYDEALQWLQQYEMELTGTTPLVAPVDTEPAISTPETDIAENPVTESQPDNGEHSGRMAENRERYAAFKARIRSIEG